MPKQSLSLLATQKSKNWQFNIGAYYMSPMQWLNGGELQKHNLKLDTNIKRTVDVGKHRLSLKLAALNIGPERYEFKDELPLEPSYMLTLEYKQ